MRVGAVGEDAAFFVAETQQRLLVNEARTRCTGTSIVSADVIPLAGNPTPNLLVRKAIFVLAAMERTTPHWIGTVRQNLTSLVTQAEVVFLVVFAAVAIMSMLIWNEI